MSSSNHSRRCDAFRVDLAAHVYGDLSERDAVTLEAHLNECAGCREELRGLQRAGAALTDQIMFPREGEIDWDAFAASTVKRALGAKPAGAAIQGSGFMGWLGHVMRSPGWAGAAAALLLVAGVAIGSWGALQVMGPGQGGQASPLAAADPSPRVQGETLIPAALLADISANTAKAGTRKYLNESRALLTSLLAAPVKCGPNGEDTVDIAMERKKSLQLLRRQRLIADQLESLPLARAREVSLDLEQLFMEILSLSDCARSEQILELRNLVEKRQLMLRLELLSDEMERSDSRDV